MTRNQIEYIKVLENRRQANQAHAETVRSNLANETISLDTLEENRRRNQASEALQLRDLIERERANRASEAETARAHRASENEISRANSAREMETWRHNRESERLSQAQIDETRRYNTEVINLRGAELEETYRSNVAREKENSRANRAREQQARRELIELQRANQAREYIQQQQAIEQHRTNVANEELTRQRNIEQERANREREQLTERNLLESIRSNVANETIKREQLNETIDYNDNFWKHNDRVQSEIERANQANEVINIAGNVIRSGQLAELIRHNLAGETETNRHNIAMELKDYNNQTIVYGSTATVTDSGNNPVVNPSSDSYYINYNGGNNYLTGPEQNPRLPPGPDGGGGDGNAKPYLVEERQVQVPWSGINNAINDALFGDDVRYTREIYSDGSSKYFMEVLRHGQIVERKQVSEKELQGEKLFVPRIGELW